MADTVPNLGNNFDVVIGGENLGNVQSATLPRPWTETFNTTIMGENGGPITSRWSRMDQSNVSQFVVEALFDKDIHGPIIEAFQQMLTDNQQWGVVEKMEGQITLKDDAGETVVTYDLVGVFLCNAYIAPRLSAASVNALTAVLTYNVDEFAVTPG